MMVASWFFAKYPEKNVSFLNRGLGGHRIRDLDPKIHVIRELAREYKATLIPLDGIFSAASVLKPSNFWTVDGVHPTNAGHALI